MRKLRPRRFSFAQAARVCRVPCAGVPRDRSHARPSALSSAHWLSSAVPRSPQRPIESYIVRASWLCARRDEPRVLVRLLLLRRLRRGPTATPVCAPQSRVRGARLEAEQASGGPGSGASGGASPHPNPSHDGPIDRRRHGWLSYIRSPTATMSSKLTMSFLLSPNLEWMRRAWRWARWG